PPKPSNRELAEKLLFGEEDEDTKPQFALGAAFRQRIDPSGDKTSIKEESSPGTIRDRLANLEKAQHEERPIRRTVVDLPVGSLKNRKFDFESMQNEQHRTNSPND